MGGAGGGRGGGGGRDCDVRMLLCQSKIHMPCACQQCIDHDCMHKDWDATCMQQSVPDGLLEARHKLAMQVGVSQAVLHILHCWAAVRVVHHNVKHLLHPELAHSLIHIVVQPPLPLLQARFALTLQPCTVAPHCLVVICAIVCVTYRCAKQCHDCTHANAEQ